jgi:hypothetical protein
VREYQRRGVRCGTNVPHVYRQHITHMYTHTSRQGINGPHVQRQHSTQVHVYTHTGNVYPYTVTDDRVGRNKKRKDNGKEFF